MVKNSIQLNYFLVLALVTAFNLVILYVRNLAEGDGSDNLRFLMFNAFLAFLPLLFAALIYWFLRKKSIMLLVAASLLWLFFYPNAPYMISDLIHVKNSDKMVLYDALILFSFAVLALFYGFLSLKIIHLCFRQRVGYKTANTIIIIAIILSSAGIYLGREIRLNSWDLFTRPLLVMQAIVDQLFPIGQNAATYVNIILFSCIQFIFLVMMRNVEALENPKLITEKNFG
jgi:uncharacterized membrane protein